MELEISTRYRGNNAIITVAGEIDVYTAPRLRSKLLAALRTGTTRVVVDLGGVQFCDSTGMNVLLYALKRAKERDISLELAHLQPTVRRVLQVTGLDTVFPVREHERPTRAPAQR